MVEKLEEFSIVLGGELVAMFVDTPPEVSEVEATISLEGDILVEVLISVVDDCEVREVEADGIIVDFGMLLVEELSEVVMPAVL